MSENEYYEFLIRPINKNKEEWEKIQEQKALEADKYQKELDNEDLPF